MNDKIGVVILAGGKSVRMGYPKPFLEVNGETMIERIHRVYSSFTDSINVVLNGEYSEGKWEHYFRNIADKFDVQLNPHPEHGRGFSLQLGLARMTKASFVIIQNVDNVVTGELIEALLAKKNKLGYTVPVMNGKRGHPVLISRRVANKILAVPPGDFRLDIFLSSFPATEVPVNDPAIFTNLNTQSDYRNFLQQLDQ